MKQFEQSGKYLKAVRHGVGKSQREMGEIAGCMGQSISNAERGLACLPLSKVKRIKNKIFGFDTEHFVRAYAQDHATRAAIKARDALRGKGTKA